MRVPSHSKQRTHPRAEWQVWQTVKLPDGILLISGVISHTTVLVEHPELVAHRIERFARAVGRENIIAGSDYGFATFAGSKELRPSIVWPKFESLVAGARIASERLWKTKDACRQKPEFRPCGKREHECYDGLGA